MPKFFVDKEQIKDKEIIILGQDVKHISKVLRAQVGDELQIGNGQTGENFLCKIQKISENEVICDIIEKIEKTVDSNIKITVFQGLPKSDKMELIIQKSVELGAFDITPTEMKRCVSKLDEKDKVKKIQRWQKIAESAAKQSGRDYIPQINNVINIAEVCKIIDNYDIILVSYEQERSNTLKQQLYQLKDKENLKIGIIIGPEGGLEKEEVDKLEQSGAKIITLGKRILRTETAALNILSIIMYELER